MKPRKPICTQRVLRGIVLLATNKDIIATLDGGWEPEVQPTKEEIEDAEAAFKWALAMIEYRGLRDVAPKDAAE